MTEKIKEFIEKEYFEDYAIGFNLAPYFNLVNKTFKTINNERQAQFLYLQKILEMVDVGIIAYNLETGDVLWVNDSILKILDLPSFKNIRFVEKRRKELFEKVFETYHFNDKSLNLQIREENLKVLISDTIFQFLPASIIKNRLLSILVILHFSIANVYYESYLYALHTFAYLFSKSYSFSMPSIWARETSILISIFL